LTVVNGRAEAEMGNGLAEADLRNGPPER